LLQVDGLPSQRVRGADRTGGAKVVLPKLQNQLAKTNSLWRLQMAKFLLSASALAITVALAAGPAIANDISSHKSAADGTGASTNTHGLSEDAFALNVMHQNSDNDVGANDLVDEGSEYDAGVKFGFETFEDQQVNVNGMNTGISAAQQGGIALGVDVADDASGGIAVNTAAQISNNNAELQQLLQGEVSLYDARVTFDDDTFNTQQVNVNGLNTGVNAAQQGGIAIGVNMESSNGGTAEAGVTTDTTSPNAKTELSDASQDALGVNVMYQEQINRAKMNTQDDQDLVEDGRYDAKVRFGSNTFDEQQVNVNGLNTGINAGQQGGIAFAYDQVSDDGAVALNVLTQVSTNKVLSDDEILDVGAVYDASIVFGEKTFEDQQVNVNGINTGMNSSQQGAIAIAVSGNASSF
jgi:hypothetical protein